MKCKFIWFASSLGIILSGCVAHIPIEEQLPTIGYSYPDKIFVSVVDERDLQGRPYTFMGVAHGVFGSSMDIKTHPWFVEGKENREQPLASALEQRIVLGFNEKGWQAEAANEGVVQSGKHLILILKEWYVRINLNLVSAFNFDWSVIVKVVSEANEPLVDFAESGRDVIDMKASQSYPNHIRLAYQDRLTKILNTPEVRDALQR